MQLSAFADLDSAHWDVAVDGRWLGDGPGDQPILNLAAFDAQSAGSARLLVLWLADGETFTLSAIRPAGAKGQDKDEITVGLPESRAPMHVFDPRLSTEYNASGTPQRFGVELWLGEDEEGDLHPLRLAGEAPAEAAALTDGAITIHPMRARRGEVDGLGLYILVRA